MTNLILTMIVAYDDFGDQLDFNKTDIENLMKKNNFIEKLIGTKVRYTNTHCNERAWIILHDNKYVTTEQFNEKFDIIYKDKIYWLVLDSFGDILNNDKFSTEIEILDGEFNWNEYSSDYYDNHDISSWWSDFTEDTLKEIIKALLESGIEIEEEEVTEDNLKLINGDIFFNETKLIDLMDSEDLEELKKSLSYAISEAQEYADNDESYNEIKKNFIKAIGKFEMTDVEENGKTKQKIYVQVDNAWERVNDFLKDEYGEYEFEDETYGNLISILKEMDYFDDFKAPNYDYITGDIDKEFLNECVVNRLEFDL